MKKTILIAAAAALLLAPTAALAKGGAGHGKGGKAAPKVMYVLHGTLSAYTAYDAATSTNGSITIAVTSANHHGRSLANSSLTFPVGPKTKISLENGVTAIADGDNGLVKIKAAKKIAPADLAATLQAATPFQVVDDGTTTG